MPLPQSGIIPEPNASALFLLLNVSDREKKGRVVARGLAAAPALIDEVSRRDRHGNLVCTVGLAPNFGM